MKDQITKSPFNYKIAFERGELESISRVLVRESKVDSKLGYKAPLIY